MTVISKNDLPTVENLFNQQGSPLFDKKPNILLDRIKIIINAFRHVFVLVAFILIPLGFTGFGKIILFLIQVIKNIFKRKLEKTNVQNGEAAVYGNVFILTQPDQIINLVSFTIYQTILNLMFRY